MRLYPEPFVFESGYGFRVAHIPSLHGPNVLEPKPNCRS